MGSPSWKDDHANLLADAAPVSAPVTQAELTRSWNRVADLTAEPARPGRRRARLAMVAALAAALTGLSGVAVADILGARTGQGPSSAEDLLLGGPGEKLDLSAPDLGDVLAEEATDIPFPNEEARRQSLQIQVQQASLAGSEEQASTGAFRGWFADDAVCSWANEWTRATRTGDEDARAEAIAMIQDAPRWPAVVDLDPQPYSRWMEARVSHEYTFATQPEGSKPIWNRRYRDNSRFYYLADLGEAVTGTDPAAVAAVLVGNGAGCDETLVPDLPDAYPPNVMK